MSKQNPFKYLTQTSDAEKSASQLYDLIGRGSYTANDAFLDATAMLDPRRRDDFLRTEAGQSLLGYDLTKQDPDRARRIVQDAGLAFGDSNLPIGRIQRIFQAAQDAGRAGSPDELRQFGIQTLASDSSFLEPRTINDYERQTSARIGNIMFNPDGTKSGRYDVGERIDTAYNNLRDKDLAGKYAQFFG